MTACRHILPDSTGQMVFGMGPIHTYNWVDEEGLLSKYIKVIYRTIGLTAR